MPAYKNLKCKKFESQKTIIFPALKFFFECVILICFGQSFIHSNTQLSHPQHFCCCLLLMFFACKLLSSINKRQFIKITCGKNLCLARLSNLCCFLTLLCVWAKNHLFKNKSVMPQTMERNQPQAEQ